MQSYAIEAIKATTYGEKAFCKFLSANDTKPDQSHQAGIYIPKNSYSLLFDSPGVKGENKDRLSEIQWHYAGEFITESRFIYYGRGTRDEYRITRTPIFRPEFTGALFVLVKRAEHSYQAFVLNSDDDINDYLDSIGLSPLETNSLIEKKSITSNEKEEILIHNFIDELNELGIEFPDSCKMAKKAREINDRLHNQLNYSILNPDQCLIDWTNSEYNVFRAIEQSRYGKFLANGFPSVDEFINVANQVLNRRKSRAGKSLEHHLSALFDSNGVRYESQVITEGNKKPDFIFPSSAAYHNYSFPTNKLISLAAKTTCKDRWRQILNEADRLKNGYKYLCTLQQGISEKQMDEMKSEKVVLVVPKPYIKSFPQSKQSDIWTIEKFVSFVKETEM